MHIDVDCAFQADDTNTVLVDVTNSFHVNAAHKLSIYFTVKAAVLTFSRKELSAVFGAQSAVFGAPSAVFGTPSAVFGAPSAWYTFSCVWYTVSLVHRQLCLAYCQVCLVHIKLCLSTTDCTCRPTVR